VKRRDLRQSLSFASISLNWPIDVREPGAPKGGQIADPAAVGAKWSPFQSA
jgi:hypothetical protein